MAVSKTNVNLPPKSDHSLRFWFGLFLVGTLVVGGAILLGRSDTGQIDVSATIIDAQTAANDADGDVTNDSVIPPTQPVSAGMPNGGLVSTNSVVLPPVADVPAEELVENASTTATSSAESGNEVINEEGAVEASEADPTSAVAMVEENI